MLWIFREETMFNLDIQLLNFIYSSCKSLGNTFGYGAFEGLVMYAGLITLGIIKGKGLSKKKC